jgi:branched-chain amino acid transport system permease protein
MKTYIKNGISSGITFSVVMTFLVLVAFHTTFAALLKPLYPASATNTFLGVSYDALSMLLFFAMIGFWCGSRGGRRVESSDELKNSMVGSGVAGLILAIVMAVVVGIIAVLNAQHVKITTYLAQMIPEAINLLILNRTPASAAVYYLIFFTIFGLIGGLIPFLLRKRNVRTHIKDGWASIKKIFMHLPAVQAFSNFSYRQWVIYGLLLIVIFLLPLWLGKYWNYTVGTIGIYVLLGLGLNIVVGLAGLLDMGYVAFFAIGAYSVSLLTAPQPLHIQWTFWEALPVGIVLAALAGVLLGIPVLRLRGDYLAIVTLGFGEIIRILSKSDLLTNFSGGPKGVKDVAGPMVFGLPFNNDIDFVYLILLSVLLVIFVTNRLKNSRVGRAWIAMREDETVAQASGINTFRYKLLAFAIGAAFAGLGGVLFASRNQFTGPEDHSLMVSINVLSIVIVGGMGSIPGVIAGAFVLKGLPEVLRELENFRIVAFGALLVVMMIIRPEGIIPSSRSRLEMQKEDAPDSPPEDEDSNSQMEEPSIPISENVSKS